MKKLLFFCFLLCLINTLHAQEYFEGEVHFKITYTPLLDGLSEELFVRELGDTLIGYVQESRYIMESNTNGAFGKSKVILLLDENIAYTISEKSDTIYKSALNQENNKLLEISRNDNDIKTVLGDECPSINLVIENVNPSIPYRKSNSTYYYNPKYKLNKKAYAIHKQGYWNRFVDEAGAISVRNESTFEPLYKSVMSAFDIIPKDVPDSLFEIDLSGKIIKEIN